MSVKINDECELFSNDGRLGTWSFDSGLEIRGNTTFLLFLFAWLNTYQILGTKQVIMTLAKSMGKYLGATPNQIEYNIPLDRESVMELGKV